MTRPLEVSRRQALAGALGLGIGIDFVASRSFSATEAVLAGRKLVVIVCRGGLDGLSLSPPIGDRDYLGLRGRIALKGFGAPGGALPLDETFGLHPALSTIHALALKGQARIAPAVATPDRERSHFEAQDVLESGAPVVYGAASGWLNRALEAMGPPGRVRAISVGPTAPLILRGKIEAASWSPGAGHAGSRLAGLLQDLYANDPLLGPALASGLSTQAMAKVAFADLATLSTPTTTREPVKPIEDGPPETMGMSQAPVARPGAAQARRLGLTLAEFMTQPEGKQVAAVSMDGFDTHANQGAEQGQLAGRLVYLDAFVDGLSAGLGPAWTNTVVLIATEFGRTARINGTGGTDHGTASTALVLGGAIRRGGMIGDWPTLRAGALYENRDTAPSLDMRGLFKGVLRDHFGLSRMALDTIVFPGSISVEPVAGLVG